MSALHKIRGAGGGGGGGGKGGGGGGGGHTPTESPDSLRSRQYARVLDMVSEGEIEGLVGGLQGVYLDDTPIENADGSQNFSGVTVDTRNGTQAQAYMAGFPEVESEVAVSTEVKAAAPVVRQISNPNIDALRLTVSVPQLTFQDPNTGDLAGTSVQIAIDVQNNGGGYVETVSDTISGKTTSRYQRSYRIELAGTGPWDIRVRRLTADSAAANLQNKTWFESYTEIIDAKLRYPNSALVGLQVDSAQFRSIPRRGYHIKGIRIRVPSNYDAATRAYTGVWDGTFQIAWSDNPAWCFYDLLTSERYGLGDFIDADQVDKWALYDIARYCDELVPDGYGSTEPRFTCNLYLQSRSEAYSVINTMASIFRGMAWWASGAVTVSADKPADATMLFTAANVVEGAFNYSGASIKQRHTVALVTWNDPEDHYRQKIEYVEDAAGIALYGVIQTEVLAAGCTSRGQAHRLGRWILYSERLETETVTFRCGMDGTYVAPGDVIQTQDAARAGKRFGGRVVSATTTAVTLDAAVTIESGKTYTLSAILPDGTLETRAVGNAPGSTSVLSVAVFSAAPQAGAIWVLAASDLSPETWRVVGVAEVEKGVLEITALAHRPDKYGAVEQNLLLEPLRTSSVNVIPASPTNLLISESLYQTGAEVKTQMAVAWDGVPGVTWDVSYRRDDNNWVILPRVDVPSITVLDMVPGFVEVRVAAVNAIGVRSIPASASTQIFGKTAPPVSVTGFSVLKVSGLGLAQWDLHPDLDVRVGGQIVIRHSPLSSGATWSDGIIVDTFDGNATTGTLALMTGTYMAKALDSSGNWSAAEASFVATEGMVTGWTTVGSSIQHPSFAGGKAGTQKLGSVLQLDVATLWDSLGGNIDTWGPVDALGGSLASGTYDFDAALDLGTVATRRFEADIQAVSFDSGDYIDARTDNIDDWSDFDGATVNDCDATLFVSTTNDNPSGSPTWGAWAPFLVSDFTCRAARFQLLLESGSVTHNISVSTLRVDAKVPA